VKDIFSASPEPTSPQPPTLLDRCFQRLVQLQLQRTKEDYAIYVADQKAIGKIPESYEKYAATRFPS
jgi:hypothetical protein